MLWTALCLTPPAPHIADQPPVSPSPTDALHTLATWCLQFTPRVALQTSAVVMELSQSQRLFGGLAALQERIHEEAPQLGVRALAWSSNSLAALALARASAARPHAGTRLPFPNSTPLTEQLDALPLHTLTATAPHQATLARLGCSTLGHLRALPRGGLRRRFDANLLLALDQLYGLQAESHRWHTVPERFQARLDLMARVEMAPALLFGARRLLMALCGWLETRHEGVTAYRLRWTYDSLRACSTDPAGELIVRTATPTRHLEHLSRLLAEHLAHVTLAAPVEEIELTALDHAPLAGANTSLLPEATPAGEALGLVMERIAARLGSQRVLQPSPRADHRIEWMTHWHTATARPTRAMAPMPPSSGDLTGDDLPQPCFVLPEPLRLSMQGAHPVYHGALRFLTGPHRIEAGWWDRQRDTQGEHTAHVARDYWVALSEQAGVLWVYQERPLSPPTSLPAPARPSESTWYLHGIFA